MALIYHLLSTQTWEKTLNEDYYRPASLESEGFIHFSTQEQVLLSAARFFGHEQELVVLAIPEKRVKARLKWEEVGNEGTFPHLYGPLDLIDIETTHLIEKQADGSWRWVE